LGNGGFWSIITVEKKPGGTMSGAAAGAELKNDITY
jgi:hypothetical protein